MNPFRSALTFLLLCSPLVLGMTIDDLKPGKTVVGPNLSTADMKGKVVLVEYWGTR